MIMLAKQIKSALFLNTSPSLLFNAYCINASKWYLHKKILKEANTPLY